MSKVKRLKFDPQQSIALEYPTYVESQDGPVVLHSDYAALEAELAEVRGANGELADALEELRGCTNPKPGMLDDWECSIKQVESALASHRKAPR